MADERLIALRAWLGEVITDLPPEAVIEKVSDDASFRRYFRLRVGAERWIAVDAPPDLEDCRPFIRVAGLLSAGNVRVPRVWHADTERGFMLLDDLGDVLLLDEVSGQPPGIAWQHYSRALVELAEIAKLPCATLPAYDADLLNREMALFVEWFAEGQLQLQLSRDERALLDRVMARLVDSALAQPTVFVHRDYHSRNLMVVDDGPPAVIDFQDAVAGPITYDLVSLLKDCYVRWPRDVVGPWVESHRQKLLANGFAVQDRDEFHGWFELMGMQRHIKCAGIFSRLNLRDGKPRYLADVPLVLAYIVETAGHMPGFEDFHRWLLTRIVPVAGAGL